MRDSSIAKLRPIAGLLLTSLALGLSACGGGGGGGSSAPPPATFSLGTSSLTFTASSPFDTTPASQTVTATVNGTLSGTLYITVVISGTAVSNVGNFSISGNSGQGVVSVFDPQLLGIGSHTGTITVHACINDQTCNTGELAGSPKTVSVNYNIAGPTPPNSVLPHVIAAGGSGQVVLRGAGLTGTNGVTFNGMAGTNVSVVSDTEVHATYPANLGLGSVSVATTGSSLNFSGTLYAVAAQALPTTTLTYPTTTNLERILAARYDGERQVLYVAAAFTDRSQNALWRYRYDSGTMSWSTPQVFAIPSLRDVSLSNDGSLLYVLTESTLISYDAANPAAPVQTVTANLPPLGGMFPVMESFAFAGDGNAVITTGYSGTALGAAPPYLFTPSSGSFQAFSRTQLFSDTVAYQAATIVASGDGTRLYADGFDTALFQYDPATELMTQTLQWEQPVGQAAAVDNRDSRLVLMNGGGVEVFAADYSSVGGIGQLNGSNILATVNPQGTRIYVFTQDPNTLANQLWTFDATTMIQVGMAANGPLPTPAGSPLLTAFSPDGLTLFVAANAGVSVIQAPQ